MTFKASLNGGAVDGVGHVDFGLLYADKPAPRPVNYLAQKHEAENAERGRELRAVLNDQDATDEAKIYALVQMRRWGIEWPDDHRVDDAEGRVTAYEERAAAQRTAREAALQAATPVATLTPVEVRQKARNKVAYLVACMLFTLSRDLDESAEVREAAREMFSNQSVEAQNVARDSKHQYGYDDTGVALGNG